MPVELLLARTDTHSVLLTQGPAQALRRRWCPGVIGISDLSCYRDGVKAASFTVDQVMDRLLAGIASR